jgi:hypothetical protein
VQYAPIALLIVIGGAMTWWYASAKNWFKAPEHKARLVD